MYIRIVYGGWRTFVKMLHGKYFNTSEVNVNTHSAAWHLQFAKVCISIHDDDDFFFHLFLSSIERYSHLLCTS